MSCYEQLYRSVRQRKGCVNWRIQIAYTGLTRIHQSFKESLLWGRRGISREGYFIFNSLLCTCAPLKTGVLCSERAPINSGVTNPWRKKGSQVPDALVMLPEWRDGNVWLVIHFRFHLLREQPGHWLHGRKMETVYGEALPNTMMFNVVHRPFLASKKDSWRNLCPQALVLQLTSPSVLQTLLSLRLHCSLEQQNHQAEKKTTIWTGILFKSQLVASRLPHQHSHSDTFWHYKEGDRLLC